jgi:LacI family transcriptional regulator
VTAHGRPATIYDVAGLAQVSIATVSKALNAPAKVAEPTRRRVLEAIRQLNFVPKETATSRARRSARRIGVFAPFSTYPSFAERLNGILTAESNQPVEVVVHDVQSAAESGRVLEALPALRSYDGVIIMSVPLSQEAADALRHGHLPAVLVDVAGYGLPSVTTDDEQGGRLAANALIRTGRTRFAFLGHRQVLPELESPSQRRLLGFRAGLAEAGFQLDPNATALAGPTFEDAIRAAIDLVGASAVPTGVFAHTDELAAAVHLVARRLGRAIPQDIALVGYDDSSIASALDLTTIRQPLRQTGEWALRALNALISDPEAVAASVTLPVGIIRRGST